MRALTRSARTRGRADELMDLLEELVLTEGFARLTVAGMAARLRCSRRTLYELAPSKSELILAVLRRFFDRERRQAAVLIHHEDRPLRRVLAYLEIEARAAARASPVAFADIASWPPSRTLYEQQARESVAGLRRLIDEGIASGTFRPLHSAFAAEAIFGAVDRMREPNFAQRTGLSGMEALQALARLVRTVLCRSDDAC